MTPGTDDTAAAGEPGPGAAAGPPAPGRPAPVRPAPVLQAPARAKPRPLLVLRYVAGVLAGLAVFWLLSGKLAEVGAAWRQIGTASPGWLAAGAGTQATATLLFAWLQRHLLRLAGARLALPGMVVLSAANDAVANSVPGQPAVASAYRFRYYRRHGASGTSAGWAVFMTLLAQATGMVAVLLAGVVVALAAGGGRTGAGLAVAGAAAAVAAAAVLARRDLVLRLSAAAVRCLRRVTGHPRGRAGARIEAGLHRMRAVPLSARVTAQVVAVATAIWCCDFATLLCGFAAVGARVPWGGVLLAYAAAQVAAALPVVPGGLGLVEGGLAVILVAYGAGKVPAVAAALAYRLVSFWLAVAVGWVCAGWLALAARRARKKCR